MYKRQDKDTITLINNHLESNKLTKADKDIYEGILKSPEKEKVKNGARLLIRKLAEASACLLYTSKRVIASQKAPVALTAPEGGSRSFTFDLEIQPILDRACIACHNGNKAFDLRGGKKDQFGYGLSCLLYTSTYASSTKTKRMKKVYWNTPGSYLNIPTLLIPKKLC